VFTLSVHEASRKNTMPADGRGCDLRLCGVPQPGRKRDRPMPPTCDARLNRRGSRSAEKLGRAKEVVALLTIAGRLRSKAATRKRFRSKSGSRKSNKARSRYGEAGSGTGRKRGIPQIVATAISGHKTDSIFKRYVIMDPSAIQDTLTVAK
jgi:hypothetical protein